MKSSEQTHMRLQQGKANSPQLIVSLSSDDDLLNWVWMIFDLIKVTAGTSHKPHFLWVETILICNFNLCQFRPGWRHSTSVCHSSAPSQKGKRYVGSVVSVKWQPAMIAISLTHHHHPNYLLTTGRTWHLFLESLVSILRSTAQSTTTLLLRLESTKKLCSW